MEVRGDGYIGLMQDEVVGVAGMDQDFFMFIRATEDEMSGSMNRQ